jgi:hypothetical protein
MSIHAFERNGTAVLSDIQARLKKYTKRDLPRFCINLINLATDHAGDKPLNGKRR